jgi:hypothetical protein
MKSSVPLTTKSRPRNKGSGVSPIDQSIAQHLIETLLTTMELKRDSAKLLNSFIGT